MKKIALLLFAAILLSCLFCGCKPQGNTTVTSYGRLDAVDHAVTEPDEQMSMSENDKKNYQKLVDGFLNREESVPLNASPDDCAFYLELLRENVYFFLVDDASYDDSATFRFSYAYDEQEQSDIISLMDSAFLGLMNTDCDENDNELDKILKLYYAVTEYLSYDHSGESTTPITDPVFRYPSDAVYRALRDKTTKCYGFSYVFTFVMRQFDFECFSVYGMYRKRSDSHMWNVFQYSGSYFNCDPAWDRSEEAYSKLTNFGKTDAERLSETVEAIDFSTYHEEGYPVPVCIDDRFNKFRGIIHFSYFSPHTFYTEDFKEREQFFHTDTFTLR